MTPGGTSGAASGSCDPGVVGWPGMGDVVGVGDEGFVGSAAGVAWMVKGGPRQDRVEEGPGEGGHAGEGHHHLGSRGGARAATGHHPNELTITPMRQPRACG